METLKIEVGTDGVGELILNRPKKLNVMNEQFFTELDHAVDLLNDDDRVRVILIRAEGRAFSAGLDLSQAGSNLAPVEGELPSDKSARFIRLLERWQRPFLRLSDHILKPVVAAVHGSCIGGGVDLCTACDVRLCSADAVFSVRETRLAMVADLGTLQRLPRLVGASSAALLAFTGADFGSVEALQWGLVSRVYKTQEELQKGAREVAAQMAANSALVLAGVKKSLLYARDHPLSDGLQHVQLWNAALMQSKDLQEAFTAFFEKRKPKFTSKL